MNNEKTQMMNDDVNTSNFENELEKLIKHEEDSEFVLLLRPLGFPVANILGTNSGSPEDPAKIEVVSRSKYYFRGNRLFVIPSSIGVVRLGKFTIGEEDQLVSTDAVPAEMFSSLSFGSDMNLDTAAPDMPLTLMFLNTGSFEVAVTSGLMGQMVRSRAERKQEQRVMAELAKMIETHAADGPPKTDAEVAAEFAASAIK
jgi:hypothetical protein